MIYVHPESLNTAVLDGTETAAALATAKKMLKRHGFWVSMYNVMTLMVWCRHHSKNRWSEAEMKDIKFWWLVREHIFLSRKEK